MADEAAPAPLPAAETTAASEPLPPTEPADPLFEGAMNHLGSAVLSEEERHLLNEKKAAEEKLKAQQRATAAQERPSP